MHLCIRADGGPDIGFGHLVRTNALAEYALERGDRVTYATGTPEHAAQVCSDGIDVVEVDPQQSTASFTSWLDTADTDLVLTDSYEIDTEAQRRIRQHTPALAVVLDDTRFTVCADVLINGNVYAPELADEYEFDGDPPTACLGLDYLLLREEMRDAVAREPPWRDPPEKALVTMGGSDIGNATPDVLRAFDGLSLDVTAVIGPGFTNGGEIRTVAEQVDTPVTVVETPTNLPELMLDADVAVSATGSTTYELLATGTPTVGVPQADNQWPIADCLSEMGALVVPDGEDSPSIRTALDSVVTIPQLRRDIRESGRRLVDGQGAERLYQELAEVAGVSQEVER